MGEDEVVWREIVAKDAISLRSITSLATIKKIIVDKLPDELYNLIKKKWGINLKLG